MTWLQFLFRLSLLVSVAIDVIVLCHVVPAFRQTRNRAFLLIAIACILGIVDTVCDHTIGLKEMTGSEYTVCRTLRRFSYFADCILWGTGIVLLTRTFLNRPPPSSHEPGT